MLGKCLWIWVMWLWPGYGWHTTIDACFSLTFSQSALLLLTFMIINSAPDSSFQVLIHPPRFPIVSIFWYPRSLNISLHSIISDFMRRRQSLKSKRSQIREFVYKLIQYIDRSCLLFLASFPLSLNVKCAKRQLKGNSWKIKCVKR